MSHAQCYIGETREHITELLSEKHHDIVYGQYTNLTIDDVRELNYTLTTSGQACVLISFSQATPQAQNALLKSLEEPHEDKTVALHVPTREHIIDTIASRVEIIDLRNTRTQTNATINIFTASVHDRIKHITDQFKSSQNPQQELQSLLEQAEQSLHILEAQSKLATYDVIKLTRKLSTLPTAQHQQLAHYLVSQFPALK